MIKSSKAGQLNKINFREIICSDIYDRFKNDGQHLCIRNYERLKTKNKYAHKIQERLLRNKE